MKPEGLMNRNDIVAIAFVTMVTVFAWIGFQTYRAYNKAPLPEETQALVAPLNPTIQEDVLIRLETAKP